MSHQITILANNTYTLRGWTHALFTQLVEYNLEAGGEPPLGGRLEGQGFGSAMTATATDSTNPQTAYLSLKRTLTLTPKFKDSEGQLKPSSFHTYKTKHDEGGKEHLIEILYAEDGGYGLAGHIDYNDAVVIVNQFPA